MKTAGLSFDNIPPLAVPLRFFLTAPLFGLAAGLLVLLSDNLWVSRWHPSLLGFTHLLTLGVMAMVMLGALFQVMPVVSSQPIPGARRIAPAVHLLLSAGTIMLVSGFLSSMPVLLVIAALAALALAFLSFLLPLARALLLATPAGDSVFSIRLAAASLLITLVLGGLRALSYTGSGFWSGLPWLTSFHVGWGLGGWILLLILGVSFQAIPMFHVAPGFPRWLTRGLTSALFISLLAFSLLPDGFLTVAAAVVAALLSIGYAVTALKLIHQRKRRLSDPTIHFWQLGFSSLIISALLLILLLITDPFPAADRLTILTGLLFGYGFTVSVIMGMLQKILPFLIYLHLQRKCLTSPEAFARLPNMKTLIPTRRSQWQLRFHIAALTLLMTSLALPALCPLAGLLIVIDFGWLFYCMLAAASLYRHTLKLVAEDNRPQAVG